MIFVDPCDHFLEGQSFSREIESISVENARLSWRRWLRLPAAVFYYKRSKQDCRAKPRVASSKSFASVVTGNTSSGMKSEKENRSA